MRNKLLVALVGCGIAAASVPQHASAAPWSGCSTGSLVVCAAFDASLTGDASTGWHLTLDVWNLYDGTAANGVSHVITWAGIGANWAGTTATLQSATFEGVGDADWIQVGNINENPVGNDIDFAGVAANGITDGLTGGGHLTLVFDLDADFDLANAVYGWHSQAVDGTTCSLWVSSNGDQTGPSSSDDCYNNVVPEPITMVLVGSGLLGIGGVGLKRRRKGFDVANG